ncbi:hypothetical protein ASD81_20015 [Nocardioides sp. Root614]|nr:hypothetical protein ASD81_20015 [Nocardioides sp. Root614]KRA86902.1 hypothetical protein ASD84_22230 [Nocardioides sp. Root682]
MTGQSTDQPGPGSSEPQAHASIEPLMLVEEAAAILRVAPDWLYRAARADRIPSVRMGRNVRFRPEDIRELRDHGLAFDE